MVKLFGVMKKAVILIISLVMVTIVLGIGNANSSEIVEDSADSVEEVMKQWENLLSISEQWTNESNDPMKVTVKWQGAWNSLLSAEEAIGALSSRLGLSNVQAETVQGHHVYTSNYNEQGVVAKLMLTPLENDTYYVRLRMEADVSENFMGFDALTELQAGYGASLIDEGVVAHWNGAIQGTVKAEGVSESSLTDAIEQSTATQFNMELVDQYHDLGTVSRTYEVKEWPIYVLSGNHKVSFQLGVHHNSEADTYDISLGSPLLTIEY